MERDLCQVDVPLLDGVGRPHVANLSSVHASDRDAVDPAEEKKDRRRSRLDTEVHVVRRGLA